MGQPKASIARSTASKSAPSATSCTKALMYGVRMRLTRKPGQSFTTMGVLPMATA
ncbi:hypothetical protein D3C72_1803590 [compost metagenome]